MRQFVLGCVVGVAAGFGAAVLWLPSRTTRTDSGSAQDAPLDQGPALAVTNKRREILAARTRPAASGDAPAGVGLAPEPAQDATDPVAAEAIEKQRLWSALRERLRAVRDANPSDPAVAALRDDLLLRLLEDRDPRQRGLAGSALVRLARMGKLTSAAIEGLASRYDDASPGTLARNYLAAAVAVGWAGDARLEGWLQKLPEHSDPDVRATVIEALDESPSQIFRAYMLRVTRDERDPDVLHALWNEDPIVASLTRTFSGPLVAALEARIAEGDLPASLRGRGLFAIGLAGAFDAPLAEASIGRLVHLDDDAGVKAFARAVLDALGRGEANVQVLEGLWHRHRRTMGSEGG